MATRARAPRDEPALQDVPIAELKGVGLALGVTLRDHGISTVGELLAHAPRRYLDLRNAHDWTLVRERRVGSMAALEALVIDAKPIGPRARRGLALMLREPAGSLVLRAVFFHAPPSLHLRATAGTSVRVVGVLRDESGGLQLVHPRLLGPESTVAPIEPVYGTVGGLTSVQLARLLDAALALRARWEDPVPPSVAASQGLIPSADALRRLHRPDARVSEAELRALVHGEGPAWRRLAFEELLALCTSLERLRQGGGRARALPFDREAMGRVEQRLGFTLTEAQRGATDVLLRNLTIDRPMRRLLVADVGSGKTAIAAVLSLAVLRAGLPVVWLAPTTLVAEQHAHTLQRAFGGEGSPFAVLTGATAPRAKEALRKALAAGQVRALVGTHALLEPGNTPREVGLVVIDEQHRFGVAQRLALTSQRAPTPHLLVLSATPIPRSLALARYGDLDLLTMHSGRPAGGGPVVTRVVAAGDMAYVEHTIRRALEAAGGGRVFVVVPRIEAEERSLVGIAPVHAWLVERFGEAQTTVVHGRLSAGEQRDALAAFRSGRSAILLGTTVVEVGLDVPEANLMVVLGAEKLGIAQLHQLRGRVGRGGRKAGCLLVPERDEPEAVARLAELAREHDGFVLAERDLARRGAGEWFGERQSGDDTSLHFADPLRMPELVSAASESARLVLEGDPSLDAHPALARAVARLLARGAAPVAEDAG